MKMGKTAKKYAIYALFSVLTLAVVSSFSPAYSIVQKTYDGISVNITPGSSTVTFYTEYSGFDWGNVITRSVDSGNTIGNIPTPSASGYTLKGWSTNVPSTTNYSVTYTTAQINSLVPTSNLTLYPILESNNDYAYTNSTYYQAGVDVTISSNSIGSTQLGKRYVGIIGIPNPVATWNDSRSLYTSSGVYKFENVNGGAMIYRKVGLQIIDSANNYWDKESTEYYRIHYFNNDSDKGWSDCLARTSHGSTYQGYFYIPGNYANIIFTRMSDGSHADWDHKWNQSGDIALTEGYSSSTITNQKNKDWWDTWKGTWIS